MAEDGIPCPDWTPEHVDLSIGPGGIREVIAGIKVKGTSSVAKPAGYDGAMLI